MRGRGLKPASDLQYGQVLAVAPHAGAWIETGNYVREDTTGQSLPMRGRGLKLMLFIRSSHLLLSLPMRGRGLKQEVKSIPCRGLSRSPCGGVD